MKEKLLKILTLLGFGAKIQAKQELSSEEWAAVAAAFEKEYGVSFEEASKQPQTATLAPETIAAMQSVLGDVAPAQTTTDPQAPAKPDVNTSVNALVNQVQNFGKRFGSQSINGRTQCQSCFWYRKPVVFVGKTLEQSYGRLRRKNR